MGDVRDSRNFMGAVIDKPCVRQERRRVDWANGAADAERRRRRRDRQLEGLVRRADVVETPDPRIDLMRRGAVRPRRHRYVYDEKRVDDTLELVD